MGAATWFAYILSFFIPIFGFVSFWVFAGREGDTDTVGRWCLIISFIGIVVYVIAAAVGISIGVSFLEPIIESIWPF
ncbi:hypothetical protein ACFLWZ_01820 [Chloroflexota bacterium]